MKKWLFLTALLLCSLSGRSQTAGDSSSVQLDPLLNVQHHDAHGLKFSLIANAVGGQMYGLQLSGISNLSHELKGTQLSAFSNICTSHIHGLQISGVSNVATGIKYGAQLSAIGNVCANELRGIQLGGYNYADTVQGLQLGLFNADICTQKGYQVGLVNYSRDTLNRRSYGLITLKPNTQLRTLLYGGTSTYFSAAMEVNNGHNYNILGLGFFNRGFSRFSGTFFYRLGRSYNLGRKWRLGADLGFYHLEGFEDTEDESPDRLYSIQPHLTADYRLTSKLSAYASLGYEMTRYYKGGKYRNGLVGELGLAVDMKPLHSHVERTIRPASLLDDPTLVTRPDQRKYPWVAAAQAAGINVFVHCFDRWALKEDFAQTTWKSMGNNFSNGFVWDNDNFSTNQFMHPYHGNLYFTSARSNGMNFWQSYPFALGGSLMWEFVGENTPPSINDVFSTSLGGAAIGETAFRISSLVLDDRTQGFERFLREALCFVVTPMRGIARLVHGDAMRHVSSGGRYHDFSRIPVHLELSSGVRYLTDHSSFFRGATSQYLNLGLKYGESMSDENKPYDFINASFTMNFWNNQPLVSDLHLLGLLWGKDMIEKEDVGVKLGLYQHFNFYSSESVVDLGNDAPHQAADAAKGNAPFRISETAALGPGAIIRFQNTGNLAFLEQRIFLNAILMGGSQSDYYRILWRDYNLGSGYSAKVNTILQFNRYGRLDFKSEFYHFFTWKGYSDEAKEIMANYKDEKELEYINAQGDKGDAKLLVVAPHFQLNLRDNLVLDFRGAFYLRHTRYKEHDSVHNRTFEMRLGLTYTL